MESEKLRRAIDYSEGDYVQVTAGENAGEIGIIMAIMLSKKGDGLVYHVRTSKRDSIVLTALNMRFLRHGDE
jgi:ribosomal protein S4E